MRQLTKLSLGMGFVCALGFAGCSSSDDSGALMHIGGGGASQAGAAGTNGDSSALGGTGTSGGTDASGGTVGSSGNGGSGGDSSALGGSAGLGGGAGTMNVAGSGGTSPLAMPAVVLFDSIAIRPKSRGDANGAGGEGGADGQTGSAGSPAQGGAAGSADSPGGLAGAPGSTGAGGAPSTVDYSRSYTFDTALQMWTLHAEGSTPNIGLAGGGEKLSARSTLSVNTTEGEPAPGSLQISIPFSQTAEQLDVNQLFAAAGTEENWTGYEMVGKLKVLSSGSLPDCLGAWLYATSTGFVFARGAEVQAKPADGWVNVRFDLDAPDVAGSKVDFDKTKINQFGVMVETNHCP